MAEARDIQAFADRVLALKADEDAIKGDIRDVYAEAVENDIDKTGLGQLVTHLRKRGKAPEDFDAKEAIFLGYLELYNIALTRTHAYARARTGEVLDTSSPSDTDEVEGSKPEASASDGRVTPSAGTGGEEDRQPIQADHISDVPKMVVDENAGSVEEINLNASNSGAFVASTAPEEINEGLAGPANAPDAGTANTKPAHSVQPVSDVALKTGLTLPAADEAEPSPKVEASSAHRVMTMTPLEPREAGGLKGFGFTVKFEDKAAAWSVTYETTPPIAMRWHEFSAPFLNSDTAAHRDMLESVRQIGVQDPIIRSGDMILDGRRRYLAARELGVPYPVTEYQGTDPLADVIRWNLDSRSVSQAERKAIAKKFKAIPSAAHRMDEIAELLGIVGA